MADAAAIIGVIRDHPLCIECIATQTGITESEVTAIIHRISSEVILVEASRPCRECGKVKHTYTIRAHA